VRRRKAFLVVGLLALSLVLASCGTRLPNTAFVQANGASSASGGLGAVSQGGRSSGGSQPGSGQGVTGAVGASGSGASAGGSGSSAGAGGAAGSPGNGAPGTSGQEGLTTGGAASGRSRSASGSSQGNVASDVGVTASTITIGNVTSINGALGPYAFGVTLNGLKAFVQAINARGGINGRKIILDTCDDSEDGQQNLACTVKLVTQDHVFALIGNNTDACASSAHYEYTQGVPDLGFPLCNGYYMYPNMFSIYGSGYPRNGKLPPTNYQQAGVYQWFRQQRHVSRGAFFFYSIPVSQQEGYAEEQGAQAAGISVAYVGGGTQAGENPAAPTFDTDVINMRADHVNVIFDAIDTAGNEKLCAAMDRQGFTVIAKVSTVEVYGQLVGSWSAPCRDSVYAYDVSLPYSDTSNPMVAQFRKDFATYEPGAPLHQWSLDGWAIGQMFADAVSSMGARPTRAGFIKWLDSWPQPQADPTGAYTVHGLFAGESWQPMDFSKPAPDCFSVAQWQDSAQTFVPRAIDACYTDGWLGTPFTPDGS
jgi:branched-chain amino acid transport system substrate-binding protein